MAPIAPTDALDLGTLPEWQLTDLYPGPDSPELARDIDEARKRADRQTVTHLHRSHHTPALRSPQNAALIVAHLQIPRVQIQKKSPSCKFKILAWPYQGYQLNFMEILQRK